jgi:hypothetical protein
LILAVFVRCAHCAGGHMSSDEASGLWSLALSMRSQTQADAGQTEHRAPLDAARPAA